MLQPPILKQTILHNMRKYNEEIDEDMLEILIR